MPEVDMVFHLPINTLIDHNSKLHKQFCTSVPAKKSGVTTFHISTIFNPIMFFICFKTDPEITCCCFLCI